MKIKEIHIYGYGKFTNKKILFANQGLQVLYGLNEAGKSTVMSFIQSILFGFPTKHQLGGRYEPKTGGTYGGAITVETDDDEIVKIERLKGNRAQELTLFYADGRIGGEKELDRLLKGVDKTAYQAIFSFDLFGLQKVYELNREKLGKYLFLTSLFGSDQIYALEEKLLKEQEELFKPNGRKPLLNKMLLELKEASETLRKAKEYEDRYHDLLQERMKLNSQLLKLADEKVKIKTELKGVEKLLSALPLLERRKTCLEKLEKFKETAAFPEDGLVRFEKLAARLNEMEIQLRTLKEKEKGLRLSLKNIRLKGRYEDEQLFEELNGQYPLIRKQIEEQKLLAVQLTNVQKQLSAELFQIFGHSDEKAVKVIDTSILVKEKIREAAKKSEQLHQRKKMLDEQFDRAKYSLEECERRLKDYQSLLLQPDEREALENELLTLEKKLSQLGDIDYVKEQMKQLKDQMTKREKSVQKKKRQRHLAAVLFTVLLAVMMLLAVVFHHWQFFYAVFPLAAAVFLFFRTAEDDLLKHLHHQYEQLEKKLASQHDVYLLEKKRRLQEIKTILWNDQQIRQKYELERMNLNGKQQAYERVIKDYEEWERDHHELKRQISPLYARFHLPKEVEAGRLLEQYDRVINCQKLTREKEAMEEQLRLYKQNVHQFLNRFEILCEVYELSANTLEEKYTELRKTIEEEKQKRSQLDACMKQLAEIEEEKKGISALYESLLKEKDQLLRLANASDDDAFRNKGKMHQKREEAVQELHFIEEQLALKESLTSHDMTMYHDEKNLKEKETRLAEKIEQIEKQEDVIRKKLAEVEVEIKDLEKSGVYSNIKYSFEWKRSQAKDVARRWAVLAVAKEMLNNAVEYHRKEKLPKLLKEIENLFRIFTSGAYTNIYLPEDQDSLLVKRKDGQIFLAEELSQGTAEQLYTALRFALAESMQKRINLPLIIDDSFVNFDHERTENIVQVMRGLSERHQLLLFTCHQHILSHFQRDEIMTLS